MELTPVAGELVCSIRKQPLSTMNEYDSPTVNKAVSAGVQWKTVDETVTISWRGTVRVVSESWTSRAIQEASAERTTA